MQRRCHSSSAWSAAEQSVYFCRLRGYEIPVYEFGTGACSGAAYNLSALYSTVVFEPEHLAPQKTLREWLKALKRDGFVLTSVIFGLIAGEGVSPLAIFWSMCCIA